MATNQRPRNIVSGSLQAVATLLAVLLFAGGIQKTTTIHKMYFQNYIILAENQNVWVSDRQNRKAAWQTPDGPDWMASAPTIQAPNGKYLAFDGTGKDPTIVLSDAKGPATERAFEIVGDVAPKKAGRGLQEGFVGTEAKLKATAGPIAGWYLSVGPEIKVRTREGTDDGRRSFVLTSDPKQAAVLTFLNKHVWVDHK